MKNTQKVTKVKLIIAQNTEYILMGLVCSEPDYKLSQSLNKKFGISLRNILPIILEDEELSFSRFSNSHDPDNNVYNLISNRSGACFLLNKLKNIDYLLQVSNSESEVNISLISSLLKEVETITAVFSIDLDTIKDKNLHYLTD